MRRLFRPPRTHDQKTEDKKQRTKDKGQHSILRYFPCSPQDVRGLGQHRVLERRVVGDEDVLRGQAAHRSEEHTSELQSPCNLVCRLLLEKKKKEKED